MLNAEGRAIYEPKNCDIDCFSDASGTGYGGYIALCAGALVEGTVVAVGAKLKCFKVQFGEKWPP